MFLASSCTPAAAAAATAAAVAAVAGKTVSVTAGATAASPAIATATAASTTTATTTAAAAAAGSLALPRILLATRPQVLRTKDNRNITKKTAKYKLYINSTELCKDDHNNKHDKQQHDKQ